MDSAGKSIANAIISLTNDLTAVDAYLSAALSATADPTEIERLIGLSKVTCRQAMKAVRIINSAYRR